MAPFTLLAFFLLCLQSVASTISSQSLEADKAPYHPTTSEDDMKDDFVVHFHPDHDLARHEAFTGISIRDQPRFLYLDFLPGYVARLTDHEIHNIIRRDPGVRLVRHDQRIQAPSVDDNPVLPHQAHAAIAKRLYTQQTESLSDSAYNLQMISAPGRVDFSKGTDSYTFLSQAGLGARVYVVDSGVNLAHELFEGRAINFGFTEDQPMTTSPYTNPPGQPMGDDIRGHGTQMAGIIGARQYGVAPFSTLVNVRVFGDADLDDGSNGVSRVSQAIHDIIKVHNSFKSGINTPPGWTGSIINMSLGFRNINPPADLTNATNAARAAGIAVVASAANAGERAGKWFPCADDTTICVGAVDKTYQQLGISNYGSEVYIMAPGERIVSLSNKYNSGVTVGTGTSQAAAHVSGAMAIWLGYEPSADPATLKERLGDNALKGLVGGLRPTQNNALLNTGIFSNARDSQRIPYVGAPNLGHLIGEDPSATAPPFAQDTWRPGQGTISFIPESTVLPSSTDDDLFFSTQTDTATSVSITTSTSSSSTAVSTPSRAPRCYVSMEVDSWFNDFTSMLPYWVQVTSMNGPNGEDLNPNKDWQRCGAASACLVTSKFSYVLELRPISTQPGNPTVEPYVQFNIGALGFRSDDPGGEGVCATHSIPPAGDPQKWSLDCIFPCAAPYDNRPTLPPPPSPTLGPSECQGLGLDLFSDGNCQNVIRSVCVDWVSCLANMPSGFSSMRRNNVPKGYTGKGTVTAYTANDCGCPTCGSHGNGVSETGCIGGWDFVANAIGLSWYVS